MDFELPRGAREGLSELRDGARKLGEGEQGPEELSDQLVARVARDDLAGPVDAREASEGVEGHDRVARVLEQMAVSRFRARDLLMGAPLLGHVTERDDGPVAFLSRREARQTVGEVPVERLVVDAVDVELRAHIWL
jgi:hypothetical protein